MKKIMLLTVFVLILILLANLSFSQALINTGSTEFDDPVKITLIEETKNL